MKLFNIFKLFGKHKEQELQPISVKKVDLKQRLQVANKKEYSAKVAITYEGKPIRQFETTVKAFNRANAAYKVDKCLGVKLISVNQKK